MYPAKASCFTQRIEAEIRCGKYGEDFPSVRELAEEFDTTKCTICKALVPLRESGVLEISSRKQAIVHREKLKQGVIVLVNRDPEWDWYQHGKKILLRIQAEGLDYFLIQKKEGENLLERLPKGTLGVMFVNSALTYEDARGLDLRKIPFVSCNFLPSYPRVNMIDFDFRECYLDFLQRAIAANRTRIGMIYVGHLEGFNKMIYSVYMRLKRELHLPVLPLDHLATNWASSTEDIVLRTLKYLKKKKDYPDILFCFTGFMMDEEDLFQELPKEVVVVAKRPEKNQPNSRVIHYTTELRPDDLWMNGYELLREVILTPDMRPVHRFLSDRYFLDSPIPKKE